MTAPDWDSIAVAVLWSHYTTEERDEIQSLDAIEEQVEHVRDCLRSARVVIREEQGTWETKLPIPRLEELYRQIWTAAAKGKVTP